MITLISGTNRHNSLTEKFALIYFELLKQKAGDARFLNLSNLPPEVLELDVYDERPSSIIEIQQQFFTGSDRFVFIIPEYNGSMPGILKLLIDVLDPKVAFKGKKAALAGIATGRAGNLRGMDHLASVLLHMDVTVMPYMLPVSRVQDEFENDTTFKSSTLKPVSRHIDLFTAF